MRRHIMRTSTCGFLRKVTDIWSVHAKTADGKLELVEFGSSAVHNQLKDLEVYTKQNTAMRSELHFTTHVRHLPDAQASHARFCTYVH